MGTSEGAWALDNERPARTVDVPAFWIDTVPVTTAAFARFIDGGGYNDGRWWTPEGWRYCREGRLRAPLFWFRVGDRWLRRRFGRTEPVPPDEPVVHVCWYEADAYARWAGRRLPTEAEWEKAASWDPATRAKRRYPWGDRRPSRRVANLAVERYGPMPVGSFPDGASAYGIEQLAGDAYEWTSSPFDGYPGFTAFPYAEYSEVFFGGDYRVLRGSSWAIGPALARTTYRNWDHPYRRQIFAGVRVAYDL
jgi:iron(II)-dependent oxidoreductase